MGKKLWEANVVQEDSQLTVCAQLVRHAERILFITGAGMSADSGLPTYRGIGGLYESATTDEGIPIEDALSGNMLRTRPELTWKYLLQIANACEGKGPNRGHEVIAALESDKDVWVITQNIDGFHHQAGSHNVIEMHGNMQSLSCMQCKAEFTREVQSNPDFPRCPDCNGWLRPSVVLFGEMLPERALQAYYQQLATGFDLIFSVGTTSVFPYISGPVEQALQQGIPCVEINPGQTELSDRVDFQVPEAAASWLGRLYDAL